MSPWEGGSNGLVAMKGDWTPMVVSSNPGTGYLMVHFTLVPPLMSLTKNDWSKIVESHSVFTKRRIILSQVLVTILESATLPNTDKERSTKFFGNPENQCFLQTVWCSVFIKGSQLDKQFMRLFQRQLKSKSRGSNLCSWKIVSN